MAGLPPLIVALPNSCGQTAEIKLCDARSLHTVTSA